MNQIKTNLQQNLGININIKRDSNNSSTIRLDHVIPHDEKLSPYQNEMSPASDKVSPVNQGITSTESSNTGVNGDTGDISPIPKDNSHQDTDSIISTNPMVGYREPFYFCKQHPNVKNIHPEEIKHHLQYSKEHPKPFT
jgi:hypothetical protein